MFDLLKEVDKLSEVYKKIEVIGYLKETTKEKNIIINNITILGKTCRASNMWQQYTYIGVINDIWYFYIETENNICNTIIVDKNCEIIFDIFYGRELIKAEKDYCIKEMKTLILYNKLHKKLLSRHKEKIRKI